MSARRARSYTAKKRPICLEALETRQLFAASISDASYVVRTDEPAAVRLDVLRYDRYWPAYTLDLSYNVVEGDTGSSASTPALVIMTPPKHGTATVSADGKSILYQPAKGYAGKDEVQYTIEDSWRLGPGQVQQLNVLVVDQSWVAVPDWTSVKSGSTVSLDVLKNDRLNANFVGASDWNLSLKSAVSNSGAQVKIASDGKSIEYLSKADFTGIDVVTYTAKDQDGYTVEGKAEVRVFASSDSNRSWPEQVRQAVIESAVNANATHFGRFDNWYQHYTPYPTLLPTFFSASSASSFIADSRVSLDRSTIDSLTGTNTQLANVDESDWVKTDGDYLYIVSQDNYRVIDAAFNTDSAYVRNLVMTLTVVDVRKPTEPKVIASRQLDSYPVSLDLHEDRLTVFYTGSQTKVDVFDVATPAQLSLVSSSEYSGYFKFARRVNDRLVVFTQSTQVPSLNYKLYDDRVNSEQAKLVASEVDRWSYSSYSQLRISELGTEFLARISEDVDSTLPGYTIHNSAGELLKSGSLVDFEQNSLARHVTNFTSLTNIITLDTGANDGGLIDWDVAQGSSQVLVTDESIYVAGNLWESNDTTIEKFDFGADEVQFAAAGIVEGSLRVDFSMDEFEGNLRIVTVGFGANSSTNEFTVQRPSTNLFVLAETEKDELSVIGSLKGLAPGETVFSVRFAEQTAYVVTAIVIDPLFVIDLSDPTKPVLKGELKVPGVSTYLEVIDENHLLSVGRGDLQWGSTAVSLFDISDPTSPKLVDREVMENSWMEMNYQAIQYLDTFKTLAIPLNGWGADGSWANRILTFAIDIDKGIEPVETIGFDSPASRSLQIGDYLYALSNIQIKVISLTDPNFEVVTLDYFDNQVPLPPKTEPGDSSHPTQTIATALPTVKVSATAGMPITVDLPFQLASELTAKIKSAIVESGVGEVEVLNDGSQVKFTPDRRARGPQLVKYIVDTESGTREATLEVEPSAWQWHNDTDQLDCNDDGRITPSDALLTINVLDQFGSISTASLDRMYGDGSMNDIHYFDINSDGHVSPMDALLVINRLNENAEARSVERSTQSALVGSGEATQVPFYETTEVERKRRS